MKKHVKIICLFLSVALITLLPFTLSACAKNNVADTTPDTDTTTDTDTMMDTGTTTDTDTTTDADKTVDKYPYTVEEVYVSKGELKIYGKLYVPNDVEGKMPAVILSHSANLNADSMNSYAISFAERGFIAYAFDFCGSSSKSRSDGNTDDMTLFSECDDLKAVIAAVSTMDNVDENNIYLFGTSQGGLVTALTAEECSASIKGEILLYPAFNIPEVVEKFSGWGSLGGYGQAFSDTLKGYDVYSHIGNFSGSVLIIHGSKDPIVNKTYSEQAATLYENCTLKVIDGAGHGFNKENYSLFKNYDTQVWEYIDEYLKQA
ncbi:MAG: alpha/beta hydrolase family protein [Candidatus Coproplasma sp.]